MESRAYRGWRRAARQRRGRRARIALGLAVGLSAAAMGSAALAGTLTGAGSTLVVPLEDEWAGAFSNATGNTIKYVAGGSGIQDISAGLVDFGTSDAPLTSAQLAACTSKAPGTCMQIPWALSATGLGYNLPGIGNGLNLTGSILAGIYLGKIKNWDNPAIRKINKGQRLPNLKITPVFRSDAAGETYTFTNYLADVDATWRTTLDYGTKVGFPAGAGEAGNEGIAARISSTSGAIGYVAAAYLIAQRITTAKIQNAAGGYVFPNPNNIRNAASWVHTVPHTNALPIVDPPKHYSIAYPISTFTYAIVPKAPAQSALVKSWLTYCVTTGHRFGFTLDFVPIPTIVQRAAVNTINSLR